LRWWTTRQNVFAIDGRTGAIRWKTSVGKQTTNMRGVAVAEGLMFSTSGDNIVHALDQQMGQPVWKTPLLTEAEEGAALVEEVDGDDLFKGLRGASDAADTAPGASAGLGLAIVKRILDLHGCVVRVRLELARGTCIEFALPQAG
jgi:K+-sensing histidine kinase KdpD